MDYIQRIDEKDNTCVVLIKIILDKNTGIKDVEPKEFFYANDGLIYIKEDEQKEDEQKAKRFGIIDFIEPAVNDLGDLETYYAIYVVAPKSKAKDIINNTVLPALAYHWKETFEIADSLGKQIQDMFINTTGLKKVQ